MTFNFGARLKFLYNEKKQFKHSGLCLFKRQITNYKQVNKLGMPGVRCVRSSRKRWVFKRFLLVKRNNTTLIMCIDVFQHVSELIFAFHANHKKQGFVFSYFVRVCVVKYPVKLVSDMHLVIFSMTTLAPALSTTVIFRTNKVLLLVYLCIIRLQKGL